MVTYFNIDRVKRATLLDLSGTAVGEDAFKYDFSTNIADVTFDGFNYPQTFSPAQAREHFAKFIANLDDFEFVDLNPKGKQREYKFALK